MDTLEDLLDALDAAIENSSMTNAATLEETLRAARGLGLLREALEKGAVDRVAVHFAINVTMDSLLPLLRDSTSADNELSESRVRWARNKVGRDARQRDVAEELGVSNRTLGRWLSHIRRLDKIPAKKGRPKASSRARVPTRNNTGK